MRILLPPSEAKRPGGSARTAAVDAFDTGSPLGPHRLKVGRALVEFCRGDSATAAEALALPSRSGVGDLEANCAIFESPVRPALDRYAGTVYEGLDAAHLTAAGRRRALDSVLIFSGLFGVLAAHEQVPVYRLPVAASVPPIGKLASFWRARLRDELAAALEGELVVDLRSSDYGAMWRPTGSVRDEVVDIRVVTEQPDGRLAVISYPSKYGKGRLARALLSARARITSVAQVAQAWTDAGERDAIVRPGGLDLVTAWVSPAGRSRPI